MVRYAQPALSWTHMEQFCIRRVNSTSCWQQLGCKAEQAQIQGCCRLKCLTFGVPDWNLWLEWRYGYDRQLAGFHAVSKNMNPHHRAALIIPGLNPSLQPSLAPGREHWFNPAALNREIPKTHVLPGRQAFATAKEKMLNHVEPCWTREVPSFKMNLEVVAYLWIIKGNIRNILYGGSLWKAFGAQVLQVLDSLTNPCRRMFQCWN